MHPGDRSQCPLEAPQHLVTPSGGAGTEVGDSERDLSPQVGEFGGRGEDPGRVQAMAGVLDRPGSGEGIRLGEQDSGVLSRVDRLRSGCDRLPPTLEMRRGFTEGQRLDVDSCCSEGPPGRTGSLVDGNCCGEVMGHVGGMDCQTAGRSLVERDAQLPVQRDLPVSRQ